MKKRVIICAVTAAVVILVVLFKIISADSIVNIEHRQIHTSDLDIFTMESGETLSVSCSRHIEELEGGVYALDLNFSDTREVKSKYSADGFVLDLSFPQDEYVDLISAYCHDGNSVREVHYYEMMAMGDASKPNPSVRLVSEGDYLRINFVFKTKPKEIKATLRYNISGKGFRLLNHFEGQQMELTID